MHINKFPLKMWMNLEKNIAPPLGKIWKAEVVCGKIDPKYEGAPRLTGCGAEIILSRKDYYKKDITTSSGSGIALFWMCPCCHIENPLPAPMVEINVKALDKGAWLRNRSDDIVRELLTGRNILDSTYRTNTEKLLNELEIELPDYYLEDIKKLGISIHVSKVIGNGE